MQISKKSQYGLTAMVYLAKKFAENKPITLKEVSRQETVPFNFLEKIILDLERAGLVRGKKGIGGGYILSKNPNKITAKDIVEILENTTAVDCSFCGKSKKCLTKKLWRKIDIAINKTLQSITLKNLIK